MGRRLVLIFSFILLSATSVYCMAYMAAFAMPYSEKGMASSVKTIFEWSGQSPWRNRPKGGETSVPQSSTPSVTAADSAAKAKGKVITKTIDSSSANLKYQKIYVKNGTTLKIDLKTELLTQPKLKIARNTSPQVLIVHTHTTEAYLTEERDYYTDKDQPRSTDDTKNMVAVGKELKKVLEEKGIGVIQAPEKHDYPEYSGSYNRAAATINAYLKKYPTIKVVIDLHRDSLTEANGSKIAPVKEIDGKKAAQIMIVSGCQSGDVTGFPNWRENFRLAIRLQQSLEVMYPGLARPLFFTPRKYNQNLTSGSLLIECGTEANTLEQAKYSAGLLGQSLAATLDRLRE